MRVPRVAAFSALMSTAWLAALPNAARALDKQGSAHGGQVAGADSGFALSGSLLGGAAIYNPTYAARPDNSGRTLGRIAPHFDVDLIGSRLSIPVDLNVFTDRRRAGAAKLVPSELDVISGVTSTWPLGPSAIELGARFERDMPVDRAGLTQSYADVRARWLYSLASAQPCVRDWLRGGDVTGYVTLGWFAYNPSYAARPDNSGRALFRYAGHAGLAAFESLLLFSVDATLFTDRRTSALAPSEIDLTLDAGTTLGPIELHLAYERDMPIDRGILVQQLAMLYVTWGFELARGAPPTH